MVRKVYWFVRLKLRYTRRPHLHIFNRKKTLWGLPIEYEVSELIGGQINRHGFFDLEVCEVLWRLAEPGSLVIDVGANIGLMTGLLAKKVGINGTVISFEPHPEIFRQLAKNAANWQGLAQIETMEYAVSDEPGEAILYFPPNFISNRGTATMIPESGAREITIRCVTLDDIVGDRVVSVVKFDIQGNELSALKGWQRALSQGLIKNILFEDMGGYPGLVSQFLESFGYHIFKIKPGFWGPKLNADPGAGQHFGWERDYLATLEPETVEKLLTPKGWQCFRS